MSLDKQLERKIEDLGSICNEWTDFVSSLGNQCAYTDRGIEQIIEVSKELERIYQKQLDKYAKM